MEKALDKCIVLVKHVAETKQRFDSGKIETLDKRKTRMELKNLEMIHIKSKPFEYSNGRARFSLDRIVIA
jgi:hypothetical protein